MQSTMGSQRNVLESIRDSTYRSGADTDSPMGKKKPRHQRDKTVMTMTGVLKESTADADIATAIKRTLARDVQIDMMRFAEFTGRDTKMNFDAFYRMMGRRVRKRFTREDIQKWFTAADFSGNGDGYLDVYDYFRWSLISGMRTHGTKSLRQLFTKHRRPGSDVLDTFEFERLAGDCGFASAAMEVFRLIDTNQSGTISYKELHRILEHCREAKFCGSNEKLFEAISEEYDGQTKDPSAWITIDTRNWVIKSRDKDGVLRELWQLLDRSGAEVADLVRIFDKDASSLMEIDEMEFYSTMRSKFGFNGGKALDHAHSFLLFLLLPRQLACVCPSSSW